MQYGSFSEERTLCSAACLFRSEVSNWQRFNVLQRWSIWRCEKSRIGGRSVFHQFWSAIKASDSWSMSGSLSEQQGHWSQGWLNRHRPKASICGPRGLLTCHLKLKAPPWGQRVGGWSLTVPVGCTPNSPVSSAPSLIFQVSSFMLKSD